MRRITISNSGDRVREIELTSYCELALVGQAADVAHPAFAKLFVQTEYVAKTGALLATRRPRSPEEQPIWAVHVATVEGEMVGAMQFETDRSRFIGRGRSIHKPVAMEGRPLGDTEGTVLDPVFSLRCRVRVAPGSAVHVAFWTLAAESRAAALELAEKYHDFTAFDRVVARAWTQAQLQSQHLGISPQEAHLFQRLANNIVYADRALRPSSEMMRRGANAQSTLWSSGISGDLPIVLMRIDKSSDLQTVRQILKAHGYWATKRLAVDLVILNEQATSYLEELQQEIELVVRTSQASPRAYSQGVKGNIFVLRADQISSEARGLLHAAARVVILGHRGSLAEQMKDLLNEESAFVPPTPPKPQPRQLAAFQRPQLEFANGIGGFATGGREYVTILEHGQTTPAPWINVVTNPDFGFHVSADGSGYTWALNSRDHQITPWSNDAVCDPSGEAIYIRDEDSGAVWTPTALPVRLENATYIARHGQGYSRFETTAYGITLELTLFVPKNDPVKIARLKIRNTSLRTRRLSVTSYTEWVLGNSRSAAAPFIITEIDSESRAMLARNPWNDAFGPRTAFVHLSGGAYSWTGDRREFIGRNGSLAEPAGLMPGARLSRRTGAGLDPCAAIQTPIEIKGGQETEVTVLLGETTTPDEARAILQRYMSANLDEILNEVMDYWDDMLGQIQVHTPDRAMNIMQNSWLLYQTVACRVMARSAFYQASGAYGYRDQLQDTMAMALTSPAWTRGHLLRAAGRQFPEGDMQHWWLPAERAAGLGVRTRFSDDPVWLGYATAYYIGVTGDEAVLDEQVPFLDGPLLRDDEHEAFFAPKQSDHHVSLYEHCALALERAMTTGDHGLPLFGGGDWNDGMNRVGIHGKGESVWLAWFIINAVNEFGPYAAKRQPERAASWRHYVAELVKSLEANAWDGEWYRRGYYDSGEPLGSVSSSECRIDAIAQSWAVISGAADPARQVQAMRAAEHHLIRPEEGLALLFTPPFDHTPNDPGYIKGYPPGLRENGGQYTHAALWSVVAFTRMGKGNEAFALYSMLNPINHANSRASTYRYKVEPYVVAADIYANPQHMGRGGWTWYTGSAGWMYRVGLESILGFYLQGDKLLIDPCIPETWPQFDITYRYKSATYLITVDNPNGVRNGVASVTLDGRELDTQNYAIPLTDDGNRHEVIVTLGHSVTSTEPLSAVGQFGGH